MFSLDAALASRASRCSFLNSRTVVSSQRRRCAGVSRSARRACWRLWAANPASNRRRCSRFMPHPNTGGQEGRLTCEAAVVDEEPDYTTECVLDTEICPGEASGGEGGYPGTGGDFATGTLGTTTDPDEGLDTGTTSGGAMAYGPTKDRCDVEAAFVEELLADLSVFAGDSIHIRPATTSALAVGDG
jgi:hypothetical protein